MPSSRIINAVDETIPVKHTLARHGDTCQQSQTLSAVLSAQEAEAARSEVQGQPRLQSQTVSEGGIIEYCLRLEKKLMV